MLAKYSKETGIAQAAKDTFSGEKPCHLCCKIADAKKAEEGKKQTEAPPAPEKTAKLLQEMLPATLADVSAPAATDHSIAPFFHGLTGHASWAISPPVPPPRHVV